jgi:hypothetical protein
VVEAKAQLEGGGMATFSRRVFLAGGPAALAGSLAAGATDAPENQCPRKRIEENILPERMTEGRLLDIPAWYYQHFDGDSTLDVPEEHFGGWKKETLPFGFDHMAVVVMHAWDAGTPEQFPGWYRCVPYIPRANAICRDVFPPLLASVRQAGMPVFHMVGGGVDYYRHLPGYKHAAALAGSEPPKHDVAATDPSRERLDKFRGEKVFVGPHNNADVGRGFDRLGFAANASPVGEEGVAENAQQLFALCKEKNINHLVYIGFAINWCLLLSPGGMADMGNKYRLMCSTIRQATTAVENKESARGEHEKESALWRVALAFGFVFDKDDFIGAMKNVKS